MWHGGALKRRFYHAHILLTLTNNSMKFGKAIYNSQIDDFCWSASVLSTIQSAILKGICRRSGIWGPFWLLMALGGCDKIYSNLLLRTMSIIKVYIDDTSSQNKENYVEVMIPEAEHRRPSVLELTTVTCSHAVWRRLMTSAMLMT